MTITNGEELALRLERNHRIDRQCPVCSGPVSTIGIVHVVYAHEECTCDRVDYVHLIEVLYHRACYKPIVCTEFRPFRVKGTRNSPTHYTDTCHVCGRLEAAHQP